MSHGNDELVLTQHAIDTIAGAYEQAAGELRDLAQTFGHIYSRQPWGTLPSILQLQSQYEQLAIGQHGSAIARITEFANSAEEVASWIRTSGNALLSADHSTASSITDSSPS